MQRFLLFLLLPCLFALVACEDDDALVPLEEVAAPGDLSLAFAVAPDNSGTVTITPGGRGVTEFLVEFGDGSGDTASVRPGGSVERVYPLGTYPVRLTGVGINGLTATLSEELTVDFAAPENLAVTVTPVAGNPLAVAVTATADLETDFTVDFGEDAGGEEETFSEGETVTYEYASVGTYDITVTARSGGTQTVSETVTVTIADPLVLPVDFEDEGRDYGLVGFGGAEVAVEPNPDPGGENPTGRVGRLLKTQGSEPWAGTVLELGAPLDFGLGQQIRLRFWSPRAGVPVLFKVENATDANVFIEVTQPTTVANAWETLTFTLAGDLSAEYSKVALFADFGSPGNGETFYFDDVTQVDDTPRVVLPLTFEETGLDFTFTAFGGASAEVVDNPDRESGNPSARVVRFAKDPNSEVWGGVFIDAATEPDFSQSQTITVKVWSPTVGATVLLKLENPDNPDVNQEVMAVTTQSGTWETLTYDFSGIEALSGIRRVVFFANFGNPGTNGNYYFDDFVVQ